MAELIAGATQPTVKPFVCGPARMTFPNGKIPVTGPAPLKRAVGKLKKGCLVVGPGRLARMYSFDLKDLEEGG